MSKKGVPQFIINPDWTAAQEERRKDPSVRFAMLQVIRSNPFSNWLSDRVEEAMFFPEDHGMKLPQQGCWIQVLKSPHTEYTVPPLSVWFAVEEIKKGHNFNSDWLRGVTFDKHLAKIVTPRGSLSLFPYEYEPINLAQFLEDNSDLVDVKFMSDVFPQDFEDRLFYMRTRGIGKALAIQMLLPGLAAPGVAWLEYQANVLGALGEKLPEPERNATIRLKKEDEKKA